MKTGVESVLAPRGLVVVGKHPEQKRPGGWRCDVGHCAFRNWSGHTHVCPSSILWQQCARRAKSLGPEIANNKNKTNALVGNRGWPANGNGTRRWLELEFIDLLTGHVEKPNMPSAATRNGLIERHARGKLEKRWNNATNQNQCTASPDQTREGYNAQQDNLETTASTESSKSRWRSRKFHVPSVSSTESLETDEASSKLSQNNECNVSSSPTTTSVDTGFPYYRQRLRPTGQREKSSYINATAVSAKEPATEVSSPQLAQQDTATTAQDDSANTPSSIATFDKNDMESPKQEFEAILSSAHRPVVHRGGGGPRVRTNGSVTSRWNPGGSSSTPKGSTTTPKETVSSTSNESSPFLSSNNLEKPGATTARSVEPSKTAKPAWAKDTMSDTEQQPPRRRSSVNRSLVSRWNETQAGSPSVGSPLLKTRSQRNVQPEDTADNDDTTSQQTEETASVETPLRSRVADIKSKFQRPAASTSRRVKSPTLQQPFVKHPAPMQQQRLAHSGSPEPGLRNTLSPETIKSVESAAPTSPAPATPEPIQVSIEPERETSNPAGWESPRQRRLRLLAESTENPSPAPIRNVSERKRGNRISDIYQSKIDQSHEIASPQQRQDQQQPTEDDSVAVRSADIEASPPPPAPEDTPPTDDTIETPQKMSVSAMKAMLWGKEEKLIVPPRSPPSSYKKSAPPAAIDSPKLVTARTKFDQTGFQPSPLRHQPEPEPIPPPKPVAETIRQDSPPPQQQEEDVVAEQPQETTRSVAPQPKPVEPKVQQPWMGRSFKKSVGAALESKIHAIWGQGEVLRISESPKPTTVLPPLPRDKSMETDRMETHVADRKGHCRAPSTGDFKVEAQQPNERGRSSTNNDPSAVRHRDLSPSNRPTNIPQWRSFDKGDAPLSPLRSDPPSRIPSYSPQHFDPAFSEAIDAPPRDLDGTDHSRPLSPNADQRMSSPVLSPRSKESYPWNQDANALSPASWQKRKEPTFDFDSEEPASAFDGPSAFHSTRGNDLEQTERESSFHVYGTEDEKKNTEDEQAELETSHRSLQQLATDSFLAVDHEQARKSLKSNRGIVSDDSSSEDQLIESAPRGYFGSDEERGPPPVRPRADTGGGGSAIFGYPDSFGSSGGVNEEVEVSVAERAKAVQTWNGGLGGTPPRPSGKQDDNLNRDLSSPVPPQSTTQGMKPSMSKRGFLLDDWQKARPANSESNDFPWTPGGMDSFTEQDWPSMRDDQFSLPDAFPSGSRQDRQLFDSPALDIRGSNSTPSANETNEVRSAANTAPTSLFVLDQHHIDAERKDLKSWRMRKGKSTSPDAAASKAKTRGFDDAAFDPFSDAFGAKPDFPEATEPTESTDFFSQGSDPFFGDILQSEQTKSLPKDKAVKTKPYIPLVLTKTMSGEGLSPDPHFSLLAPPSIEEVWSYEVGLTPTGSSQRPINEEPVVYDADVSTLNESAAEI